MKPPKSHLVNSQLTERRLITRALCSGLQTRTIKSHSHSVDDDRHVSLESAHPQNFNNGQLVGYIINLDGDRFWYDAREFMLCVEVFADLYQWAFFDYRLGAGVRYGRLMHEAKGAKLRYVDLFDLWDIPQQKVFMRKYELNDYDDVLFLDQSEVDWADDGQLTDFDYGRWGLNDWAKKTAMSAKQIEVIVEVNAGVATPKLVPSGIDLTIEDHDTQELNDDGTPIIETSTYTNVGD